MDALQADIDALENEKAELKERLKVLSKKNLLGEMSRTAGMGGGVLAGGGAGGGGVSVTDSPMLLQQVSVGKEQRTILCDNYLVMVWAGVGGGALAGGAGRGGGVSVTDSPMLLQQVSGLKGQHSDTIMCDNYLLYCMGRYGGLVYYDVNFGIGVSVTESVHVTPIGGELSYGLKR